MRIERFIPLPQRATPLLYLRDFHAVRHCRSKEMMTYRKVTWQTNRPAIKVKQSEVKQHLNRTL